MDVERTFRSNVSVGDTSFVVTALNRDDARYELARNAYLGYQRILLPQTVLAEVAYLLGRELGGSAVATFLRTLPDSRFRLVALTDDDVARVASILDRYADSRIDFVDASVMAVAERERITTIMTLDQRDFRIYRPNHCESFTLLP